MTSEEIRTELPALRRYARALTGSQASGDGCVRQLLHGLINRNFQLDQYLPPRLALFRLFHQIWLRSPARLAYDHAGHRATVDQYLQGLDVENREALLLTAVEEFLVPEAAVILDRSSEEVESDIAAALQALGLDLQSRILIIEDEPVIALDLEDLVEELGHVVAGVATTCDNAVRLARKSHPQLILSDIKLADGSSGCEATSRIIRESDVPVIFITAFPEALLTGERPEPTYLVTKPFTRNAVSALIGQALLFHRSRLAA